MIAHYRKIYELEIELAVIYHEIYRTMLTNHCGALQDITLDLVRKTADATTVSVLVRLPNDSRLEFQIAEADGRWKFYGFPSSLLEITETGDEIPEKFITKSTSPQMESDLNRVLSEIEAEYSV